MFFFCYWSSTKDSPGWICQTLWFHFLALWHSFATWNFTFIPHQNWFIIQLHFTLQTYIVTVFQQVNFDLVNINSQSLTQIQLDHLEECSAGRLCSDHRIVLKDSLCTILTVSLHSGNTLTPLLDCLATLNDASEAQSPHKFSVYVYPHLYFTKYKCEMALTRTVKWGNFTIGWLSTSCRVFTGL